jgi:hypothetical protein
VENRRRFFNPAQPQTLQIATFLLYFNGVFAFIGLLGNSSTYFMLRVLLVAGGVLGGFGIANERKWGYGVGIAMAFAPFLINWWFLDNPLAANLLALMFDVALVALLLHPQSRDYQRIWFK